MISEERIMEIAECCPIWYAIPQGREKALLTSFARAIEREAYKQGQEDMMERAVKECQDIEMAYHRKWKEDYLPHDQGMSDGATECSEGIRNIEIEEPK